MEFPYLNEVTRYRDMTTAFGGYDHRLSCAEGQFYDMKNMTTQYYPILSPREKRGIVRNLTNPQGILDKEELMWIDGDKLYSDGEEVVLDGVTISTEESMCPKTMCKMGAYVIIMPDKIWYNADNGECGYMENTFVLIRLKGMPYFFWIPLMLMPVVTYSYLIFSQVSSDICIALFFGIFSPLSCHKSILNHLIALILTSCFPMHLKTF